MLDEFDEFENQFKVKTFKLKFKLKAYAERVTVKSSQCELKCEAVRVWDRKTVLKKFETAIRSIPPSSRGCSNEATAL